MVTTITLLRALADPTRLRILALVEEIELAIGEIAQVIGQSQPRVSRHVRILVEAGLVDRRKEGGWVFLRASTGAAARACFAFLSATEMSDAETAIHEADRKALSQVHEERNEAARRYFADHSAEWDEIGTLYAPNGDIESAMESMLGERPLGRLLDLGTGTGRMVELFGRQADIAVALDRSPEMLRVARAKLVPQGAAVDFVQGDFNALPFEHSEFDTVILHQALHYATTPQQVVSEVARVLAQGGIALFADFAPHLRENARTGKAHARLGFSHDQIRQWLRDHSMQLEAQTEIASGDLTVCLWLARRLTDSGQGGDWSQKTRRDAA